MNVPSRSRSRWLRERQAHVRQFSPNGTPRGQISNARAASHVASSRTWSAREKQVRVTAAMSGLQQSHERMRGNKRMRGNERDCDCANGSSCDWCNDEPRAKCPAIAQLPMLEWSTVAPRRVSLPGINWCSRCYRYASDKVTSTELTRDGFGPRDDDVLRKMPEGLAVLGDGKKVCLRCYLQEAVPQKKMLWGVLYKVCCDFKVKME